MSDPKLTNLWGDLPAPKLVSAPSSILRHQANLLSNLTQGMLIGEVSQSSDWDEINFHLLIRVPSLGNYVVKLISIEHGPTLYPVKVTNSLASNYSMCENQEAFEGRVGVILSSDETKKIIQGLLSAAASSSPDA